MTPFVEERLDMGYDDGAVGGPVFSTDIVVFGSGYEVRNANWSESRGRWELGERNIGSDTLATLQSFFRARRGKAVGFRYKDWNDYKANNQPLAVDGTPSVQLTKTYSSGGVDQVRDIVKPVSGSDSMQRGGSPFSSYTLDTTTGIVTLLADSTVSVTGISKANPAVVTAAGHGFITGDVIYLTGVGGMVEINDNAYTITKVDDNSFRLDGINSTGFTAYISGGSAEKYVQPGESLTWSGEFDVPVRFDTDEFRARFVAIEPGRDFSIYFLSSLNVVEIRLLS